MEFDVPYLLRHLPALGRGLALTIQVSALAIVLSVFVGLVGASLRVMRFPVLSQAAAAYVEFIRNTPLLVQLFFVFFGLPTVGLTLSRQRYCSTAKLSRTSKSASPNVSILACWFSTVGKVAH